MSNFFPKDFCKQFASDLASLSERQIIRRRNDIISRIEEKLKEENLDLNVNTINEVFTERMFNFILELYDEVFFFHTLLPTFRDNKCCLTICMENRCSRVGGKCWRKGKVFTIKLSTKVMLNSFSKDRVERSVGNVECRKILECILLMLEHELTHAILGCDCIDSAYSNTKSLTFGNYNGETHPKSGHSITFMSLLKNRFGHTDFKHNVYGVNKEQEGKQYYSQKDFKKGDEVIIYSNLTKKSTAATSGKVKALVKIDRLNKKTFSFFLIDKEIRKIMGYSKDKKALFKNAPYRLIVNKVIETEYESGSPSVKPKVITDKTSNKPNNKPSNKPKTVKSKCNIRNPDPPCKEGFIEKKRPNGALCCYKDYTVVKTKKTYKFKKIIKPESKKNQPEPKKNQPEPKKNQPEPKKTQKSGDQIKCNMRNPDPPCKDGFIEKKRPNGAVCCYKDYSKKTVKSKSSIKEIEDKMYLLDFPYKPIVYEDIDNKMDINKLDNDIQKYISKLPIYVWNKPLIYDRMSLNSNKSNSILNTIFEEKINKKIKNLHFYLILIKDVVYYDYTKKTDVVLLVRNEADYVRYALELVNVNQKITDKAKINMWK